MHPASPAYTLRSCESRTDGMAGGRRLLELERLADAGPVGAGANVDGAGDRAELDVAVL